ncbi:MAG: ThuA domain-containing protein [Balneolaceae bacterium]
MKNIKYTLVILIMTFYVNPSFGQQFEVMVYTNPDRWHDSVVPNAMKAFEEMALRHDFGLTWAQIAGTGGVTDPFTDEYLERFDAIVFLNASERLFSDEQKESFKRFIRNGGGFVGIHSTLGGSSEEWFQKLRGRASSLHPEEQTAVYHVIDKNFPATMHLPDRWIFTGELYAHGPELTDNLNYLITVDEDTYDPSRTWGDDRETAMGDFHPMVWYQEYEGGRSFYTSLGHLPAVYNDPWFLAHIYGGIYWAATGLGIY